VSRTFAVVVNECASVAHPNPRPVNFRATENADANFRFQPQTLATGLWRELTATEMDWLELIVSMYAADLACGRGEGDLDWGRDIELHVPLRDPAAMEPNRIALQEIFDDLTSDRIRMTFHEEPDPLPAPRYGREWPAFDCVALFSGGVDSFVGTAALLDSGKAPLLLSHGQGAVTTPQLASRSFLATRFGESPEARITAYKRDSFRDNEESQRARSLLFMGGAAVIAAVKGTNDIYLNENGVMAVHVPLTSARIGSLSTKTAYPPIVEKIAAVTSRALNAPLRIHNELVRQTKPEVVARAKGLGVDGALSDTASCWSWHRGREHCGVCVPCLTRRISFELESVHDQKHAADPFGTPTDVQRPFARDNLAHLCEVVEAVEGLSDIDFELDHPEILDGGKMISPREARDLYRRWASQALQVLRSYPVPRQFLS
jgi:7-cyano-7-deazaguanine synthase in queuosine biosynthesis